MVAVAAGRVRAGRETRTHAHHVLRCTSAERVRERGRVFERFVFILSRNGKKKSLPETRPRQRVKRIRETRRLQDRSKTQNDRTCIV